MSLQGILFISGPSAELVFMLRTAERWSRWWRSSLLWDLSFSLKAAECFQFWPPLGNKFLALPSHSQGPSITKQLFHILHSKAVSIFLCIKACILLVADSAWPYKLLTPIGCALKITFFEKLHLREGHKYNLHGFFGPDYCIEIPYLFITFLTVYFQRSIHKMPSVMEVGKDNWCYVGTCAKLFSMRCHRNRLCSFFGGAKPKSCVMDCWLLRNQITDTCRALLLFLSLMLSTRGKNTWV